MSGTVPISLLLDIASSKGIYTQSPLDLNVPIWVFVDPEYLISIPNSISYYSSDGLKYGIYSSIDHPSFTRTREMLGGRGYIKIEDGWINGDRVLKPFYFNNVLLDEGEQFSCASAMYYRHHKNYNDGKPDFTVKNYNEEESF